jgi:hypothetical protein
MKLYGRAAVSEFLGDNVIYRNLEPLDARLPSLNDLRVSIGLPPGVTPRKSTKGYAQVVAKILTAARQLDAPDTPIERVIFVGDTRLNDSTAFANICRAGNWPGRAFIGAENDADKSIEIEEIDIGAVLVANKWQALTDFQEYLAAQNFAVNQNTAILLDLDKTTLGARGRNDHVINQARVDAAILTVKDALGEKFDSEQFQTVYDYFNQVRFHPFTTDNQDYLVYICLMVGVGLYSQHGMKCAIDNEVLENFDEMLTQVERRSVELPAEIQAIHQDVYHRVQSGDPTPFKAFRRAELRATAARMGQLGSDLSISERLSQEIVITHEVRELMLAWKAQGALIFGLSDKPDEASIPTPEMESEGYLPIHRIETSVVGT